MEKTDLIKLLDEEFMPLGFKRKGNNWKYQNDELCKMINLQKSSYSCSFYINYGYIINGLELTTSMHVEERLGSTNKKEQRLITDLLDLETEISDKERISNLRMFIQNIIVKEMQRINTQNDLYVEIKDKPYIDALLPIVVREYFKLGI